MFVCTFSHIGYQKVDKLWARLCEHDEHVSPSLYRFSGFFYFVIWGRKNKFYVRLVRFYFTRDLLAKCAGWLKFSLSNRGKRRESRPQQVASMVKRVAAPRGQPRGRRPPSSPTRPFDSLALEGDSGQIFQKDVRRKILLGGVSVCEEGGGDCQTTVRACGRAPSAFYRHPLRMRRLLFAH